MAYTNEIVRNRINHLIDINSLGHAWTHFHVTNTMLLERMHCDQTLASSGFSEDFTTEDLKAGIREAAEDWLEEITDWLNDKDMSPENMRFAIDVVIGTGFYRATWCDWSIGTQCSVLVIALKRTITKDGGFSLEIVTAFPEPNEEQKRR